MSVVLCLAATAAGCSATLEDASEAPESPAATASSSSPSASPVPSGTPSPSPSSLPAIAGTWLYEVPSEAARASGERTEADLAGDAGTDRFVHSTTQWAGCEGIADVTDYRLDEGYGLLTGRVALREGVPAGLVVEVQFDVDGAPVSRVRVEADGGAPVQISLTGAKALTVTAEVTDGTCADAQESYVVLADASVS